MSDVDGHYLNELETDNLKKELLNKLIDEPTKLCEWDFHDGLFDKISNALLYPLRKKLHGNSEESL